MKFTKHISFSIICILFLLSLWACGNTGDNGSENAGDDDTASDDDSFSDDDSGGDNPGDDDDDSAADDDAAASTPLIAGPNDPDYDPILESLARKYDRQFHVFNAYGMDLNSDVVVPLDQTEHRDLIARFLNESDSWDFESFSSGLTPFDVITEYQAVAGLYAGVGIAADAFRYAVLKEQGYPDDEIALAQQHLEKALEALHIAVAITGTPGVIARGYLRTDIPGNASQIELTPLFDDHGNPLPTEKNNGTWRADNSGGQYPNYIWIDSCSRDQYIGWAAGFAGAWEIIHDDPAFSDDLKNRLREDTRQLGLALSVVRASGFDLEIPDADGRTTYHGYLNENNYDRIYLPWLPIKDGMYSMMALGILAALNFVADDPDLHSYIYDTLIAKRKLDLIAKSNQMGVDLGVISNYSSYNMAFMGALLGIRYIEDDDAREALKFALDKKLYDKPFRTRQPVEIAQSLFDFVYAAGMAGSTVNTHMTQERDYAAIERGLQTLNEFAVPPYWEFQVINCDEQEIETLKCYGLDGTELDLLGYVGRGDKLVSKQPVPMRIRPPSNYHWRSNPYEVNGGSDGSRLLPGVDFRFAYWYGRWAK